MINQYITMTDALMPWKLCALVSLSLSHSLFLSFLIFPFCLDLIFNLLWIPHFQQKPWWCYRVTKDQIWSLPFKILQSIQKLDECINVYSISWKGGSERLCIDIQRRKKLNLQLTVEQSSFELFMSGFPPPQKKTTIVLYNSQLVESTNTELCIGRGNYET